MPSPDDELLSCFRRQLSAASRRGAVLAGLVFLPAACGDDVIVAHDPVAPQGEAGEPSSSDNPQDGLGGAGTGQLPVDPEAPAGGIATLPDVASGGSPDSDLLALGVLERLEDLCGACHANGDNGAGFSGGLDLARLIESGIIVPGSSATSPLLARILDGSMPPGGAPGQLQRGGDPTTGDIALLADFIDQLATEPAPRCEPLPFVGLDAAYASVLADVQSRPAEERTVLRYVSLTDASNARLCGPALEQRRQALFKLLNGLSMASEIHLPAAVDADALIYRVDLRDYGWDREIDLDGDGSVDVADGWEAALGAVPYGVAFDGPEASALSAETGAPIPLSSLGALTRVVGSGHIYRALLGVPANIYDMELLLGLDTLVEIEDGNVQRAGFFRYPPRSEVMVTRFPLGELDDGAYWFLSIDDSGNFGGSNIFDDALSSYVVGWTKAMWELPNGLWAYSLNDPGGAPLADMPRACDDTCVRREWLAPVACMACHAHGLQPLRDMIRAYTEENERLFDRETFADTLALFPPAPELDQIIAGDNDRYRAALERSGVQPGAPDPVSRVYLDFDRPLDLERAAAELGVPAQTLADHLGALPALAPLGDPSGGVDRTLFNAAHLEALCVVHSTSRNRPAACP